MLSKSNKKVFEPWKTILSEAMFSTPWMSVYHNMFELPNGKKGNYYYVHTNGSSLIVPITDSGKILMIRQYRYLFDEVSIEIPCGGIKDGQNEAETARSELIEETGYNCKSLKRVGKFVPYNGISDEVCHVFIATGLYFVGEKPDDTEQIETFEADIEEIDRMIQKGKITDGMSIAGWTLAKPYVIKKIK